MFESPFIASLVKCSLPPPLPSLSLPLGDWPLAEMAQGKIHFLHTPPTDTHTHDMRQLAVVLWRKTKPAVPPSRLTLDVVRTVKLHVGRGSLVLLPIRLLRLQALVVHVLQRHSYTSR